MSLSLIAKNKEYTNVTAFIHCHSCHHYLPSSYCDWVSLGENTNILWYLLFSMNAGSVALSLYVNRALLKPAKTPCPCFKPVHCAFFSFPWIFCILSVGSGLGQIGPDPSLVHSVQQVFGVERESVSCRQHLPLALLLQWRYRVLLSQSHLIDQIP